MQKKVINGYDCFNLYIYFYSMIMFDSRYKYISNRLLKKYVVKKYLQSLRLRG